ncbi:hypothetical protein TSAR_008991 [Trichomalopsis sarcophagae]|uniref:Uncharacterized protein n=1 Tax=Trichomalopsis sarcophagae TaxID=543379 RepID=A0A232ETV1_9HYME|nr:hypothetical protein TSAR_008991 [Trichomalopsis sarcophagae]
MARFVRYVVFVLFALQYQIAGAIEPVTVIVIASSVISFCQLLWDNIEKSKIFDRYSADDKIVNPFWGGESDTEKLLKELRRIAAASNQVNKELHAVKDMLLGEVTVDIEKLQKLTEILRKIYTNIVIIDNTYNDFLEYVERGEAYDKSLLIKFAEDALTEGPCGVVDILRENNQHLHQSILGERTVQDLIVENADIFLRGSKDSQSPQQFLYNLMSTMIFSEVKAYFIMRYSITILKTYKGKNYQGHIIKIDKDVGERLNNTIGAFKAAMKVTSREFYRTDPDEHIEDKTYLKLNHLFQTIIINERNLGETHCKNYCDTGRYHVNRNKCFVEEDKDPLCKKQRTCDGLLTQCRRTSAAKVCLPENKWTSDRRYEYLIDEDNLLKGKKNGNCPGQSVQLSTHIYWGSQGKKKNVGRCDWCMCRCYDPKPYSDNRFSVKLNKARYENNFVVTGARFVKDDHVMYIQLQEGRLQAGGVIDEKTLNWASYWESPQQFFATDGDHHHDINLDDLQAPVGHVIVGVGLKEIIRNNVKMLGLQILTKPVNFTSGELLGSSTNHMVFEPSWSNDKEVKIKEYDIPTNSIAKSVNISQPGQFVRLQLSGFDSDVGQNTIPFFDKQPVTTSPSALISGLGLYHKHRQNSGGFVGIKLITFDYEPHLDPDL